MRVWQIFAAVIFLSAPAAAQGPLDPAVLQRDIAQGNTLIERWIHCTQAAAAKLATGSQEGAEVVSVAVFGACSSFQNDLFLHMLRTHMKVEMADDYMAKYKAKIREQIIAQVLTLRAKSPLR